MSAIDRSSGTLRGKRLSAARNRAWRCDLINEMLNLGRESVPDATIPWRLRRVPVDEADCSAGPVGTVMLAELINSAILIRC
jgi:hypothetical protein